MPTILIVEDEVSCRLPLTRLLQIEGYDVVEAGDGLEALQRLDERKIDLILLDMVMPRMGGIEFLERMRADARWAAMAVFLVTAYHDPQMLARAKELGIEQYLFKGDVPFMRMLELIKRQLGEPFTPVRRGRKPKNPRPEEPTPPGAAGDGNGGGKAGRRGMDRGRRGDTGAGAMQFDEESEFAE
jgi:CheY-like chemotaxis protein